MRRIREGEQYMADDTDIELEQADPRPAPPVEIQGEPWGWTKPGPRPKGFRADGRYDGMTAADAERAELEGRDRGAH